MFVEQYELREKHFERTLETKSLEAQLLTAKADQEVAQYEQKLELLTAEKAALLATETELRAQLAMYTEKFEGFQETLSRSNEVFAAFKKEMEKMTATIKRLEAENQAQRVKADKSDVALIDMLEAKNAALKELETERGRRTKLEQLCRALRAKAAAAAKPPPPGDAAVAPEEGGTEAEA
eukprot:PLAT1859.1.p2 GENE.PLAT1859.1~~PLAT1859.1.p2  ORF type:complete len:180 (-),score=111.07 PLAT1859.1:166-705(-)